MNRLMRRPLRAGMPSHLPRAPFLPWFLVLAAALPGQIVIELPQVPQRVAAPRPVLGIGGDVMPRNKLAAADPAAAAAILRGVDWLRAHQEKDGRWDADGWMRHDGDGAGDGAGNGAGSPVHDVAVTGLALWVLAREGKAERADPRYDSMVRGTHWLVLQQQQDGLLGMKAAHDFVYDHTIGALGLCGAAAATGSAEASAAAGRALQYLEQHRNPFGVWRYQPRDGDNDSSVTTWAVAACLAGREVGINVAPACLDHTLSWFDMVTDGDGRAGYAQRGERSSRKPQTVASFPPEHGEAMTAAALWCRHALGDDPAKMPVLAASAKLVSAKPPSWLPAEGKVDLCYWYFGSEALRRVGGEQRAQWNKHLVEALLKGQRTEGATAGSWDPHDPWGEDGGRIYATALAVLALQCLYELPPPVAAAEAPPAAK